MPNYKRACVSGGTFFFTVVTHARAPFLCDPLARTLLRSAIEECRKARPFDIEAMVLMPDHLHCIWKLPEVDADFSTRWGAVKKSFTQAWLSTGGLNLGVSMSRKANRRRGVWQPRFWEHWVRDTADLERRLNYIHYNPVKHGYAKCPHDWPHSTFARWVRHSAYAPDWQCACDGRTPEPIQFHGVDEMPIE